jgi:hypothetical protein
VLPFKRTEDPEQRGVDEGAVPEVALISLLLVPPSGHLLPVYNRLVAGL